MEYMKFKDPKAKSRQDVPGSPTHKHGRESVEGPAHIAQTGSCKAARTNTGKTFLIMIIFISTVTE